MGYIYKITNTVNQKSYIGISIHEPEKHRIKHHLSGGRKSNRLIARDVKKYGKDAFTYKILEANVFDELLPNLEVAYIANYNTVSPNGYNLSYGGEGGGSPSEETRQKISQTMKSKPLSAERLRKIRETHKGKIVTAETRKKMSEAAKNRTRTAEHCRNLSKTNKGKKHSAETRNKMSEVRKGERHPFFGKKHTAEARQKMAVAKIHPNQISARDFFFSLPLAMSLKEKRKFLYHKFPNVAKRTIRTWTLKWHDQ